MVTERGTALRLVGWVLAVAVTALAVGAQLSSRASPDVAWILYATRELLHGARLGVDLVENTPPMIFALNLPVAVFAERFGVSLWGAWVVAVAGLAVAVVVVASTILRRSSSECDPLPGLIPALLTVLLLIPANDYGQRDHLALVLAVPYIALASLRLRGQRLPAGWAVLIGVAAALGVGIKPHFVFLPIGLVALLWPRMRFRGAVLPEQCAVAAVGVVYVLAVWVLVPDYYTYARQYGGLYQHFLRMDLVTFLLVGEGIMLPLMALATFVALRPGLVRQWVALADTLAVATGMFLLAAVLQAKGWRYHLVPALSLSLWLAALLAMRADWRLLRPIARLYVFVAGLACGVTVIGAARIATERMRFPRSPRFDIDPSLARLLPLVQAVPKGEAVVVLSTNIASGFPLVLDGGGRWGLRHPSLWPLVAFYHRQIASPAGVTISPFELRSEFEQHFDQGVVADLVANRPALILVHVRLPVWNAGSRASREEPLPPRLEVVGGGAHQFDYLDYFSPVQGMTMLLRSYRSLGQVGAYRVLWRADLASSAPVLLDSAPGP